MPASLEKSVELSDVCCCPSVIVTQKDVKTLSEGCSGQSHNCCKQIGSHCEDHCFRGKGKMGCDEGCSLATAVCSERSSRPSASYLLIPRIW